MRKTTATALSKLYDVDSQLIYVIGKMETHPLVADSIILSSALKQIQEARKTLIKIEYALETGDNDA